MGNRFDMECQQMPYKLIRNQQVGGSSPLAGTIKSKTYLISALFSRSGVDFWVDFY